MEWENKTEMVRLGNQRDNDEKSKKEFQKFVTDNISSFDIQAWDMFTNLSDLIIDDMKKDIEYWKTVYTHIKLVDCNNPTFGLRTALRIAMIQTICTDILECK